MLELINAAREEAARIRRAAATEIATSAAEDMMTDAWRWELLARQSENELNALKKALKAFERVPA